MPTSPSPSDQPAQVFLVDDDPSVNRAIANLLESAGFRVSAFLSAEDFLGTTAPGDASCLILDLRLPGISGLELQQRIRDSGGILPIVFITGHGGVADGVLAMKHGAVNFLLKPFDDQALLDAVDEAVQRGWAMRRDQQHRYDAERRIATLTEREREVMEWVVAGLRNRDIAHHLGVTEQTIKVHRGKIMNKTGAASLCDLVRLADRVLPAHPPPAE